MKKLLPYIVFLILSTPVFSQAWKTYPYTPTGSLVGFPVDEGRHSSEPAEWWYTMGHLTGSTTGKQYSYILSYFYYPVNIFDGFRILNIADDDLGVFISETKALNYNTLSTNSLSIEANIFQGGTETWHNKTDIHGDPLAFEYEISANSSIGALNLEYDAQKPPLILADSGFLNQGTNAYSYYYSQTQNEVSGSITFNGITESVIGTSWIDRQYGTFNPSQGHEYEWFCVRLSNGMDFNIYNIFASNNEIPDVLRYRIFSAYLDENTQYTTSDFEIERLAYHYMPDSSMCYSQEWRITCSYLEVDIVVSTLHSHYEVLQPFKFYEGPTTVTGTVSGNTVSGVGFAELLHSYEKPDIQISGITGIEDGSCMLRWQLQNPDDGNPLRYDLEYSIDERQSFSPIAQDIADTFYYWSSQDLSEQNDIWLKVTGHSIDNTVSKASIEELQIITSLEKNYNSQNQIDIFPSPAQDYLKIQNPNNLIFNYELVNLNGQTVKRGSIKNKELTLDISDLKTGSYLFKVIRNNTVLQTRKIVKL